MSGNNPVIVMPTAHLEAAAEGIIRSAFASNGQHCAGCSRVYVHRKVIKRLVALLVERTAALKIGDPLARDTAIGPLISAGAVAKYKAAVALGRKQGRLLIGGKTLHASALAPGFFVEPVLFDQLPANARLLQSELLVPALGIVEVASLAEAITLANQNSYGRAAGIFTAVEAEQVEFFNHIEAAAAYCNRREGATTGGWPGVQSVGGWKASSSSSRNTLGPFYVPQFLREQSQTIAH
jgi:1-pyrroline-5-carboxylate dehydrogenase